MRASLPSRVLLVACCVALATLMVGCATHADAQPAATRLAIIGDSRIGPSGETLASMLPATAALTSSVQDLSSPDATLERVVQGQLALLRQIDPDVIVVRLGPADCTDTSSLGVGRYSALLGALLYTLTGARAAVIVSAIDVPEGSAARDATARLERARALRRAQVCNEAVRAVVTQNRATLVELEAERAALLGEEPSTEPWRRAIVTALGGRATPAPPQMNRWLTGSGSGSLWRVQARLSSGRAAGLRPDVIAKIGDSITSAPEFLAPLATPEAKASLPPGYAAAVAELDARALDDAGETSLTRQSVAAAPGWRVGHVLIGGANSPLLRELRQTRAAIAVVMFGTNDLTQDSIETFEEGMDQALRVLEAERVQPLLSTIPDRADIPGFAERVPEFNAAIRALATAYGVPLIDYNAAMARLPNRGLSQDGIHPSICPEGAGVLTPTCLRYGYNLRNLLTVQAVAALKGRAVAASDLLSADDPALP